MTNFIDALETENNWKKTENDADALKSTGEKLLDLFATIGALRERSDDDIQKAFSLAMSENKLLATKMSFYARNIRGGLGERRTPRIIWQWMAKLYPDILIKNIHLIPEFGRWDDLYCLVGTPVEFAIWNLINSQMEKDMMDMDLGKNISLMAKWLKSINTSSPESKKLGKLTAQKLGLCEKTYRKTLSRLRAYIDVVEQKMSSGNWLDISYSHVPSRAMNIYRNAFLKHDEIGFLSFLENVKDGKEKINSSTLYPYDIIEKILYRNEYSDVLEEQWKALPNYIEEENNILIMADVSGSMRGRPMATSVGLAIYFAERNTGIFHNKFMTFSGSPELVTLTGSTLYEKANNARSASWQINTDIELAFRTILNACVNNNVSQDQMPKELIIISDMEFDRATSTSRQTYMYKMKTLYENAGYILPKIIFWNVDARQNTFHAQPEDNVQFASGQATSVFLSLLKGADLSAYSLMLETLSDPIYNVVTI